MYGQKETEVSVRLFEVEISDPEAENTKEHESRGQNS